MKAVVFLVDTEGHRKGDIALLPAAQAQAFIQLRVAVACGTTARRSLKDRMILKKH